MYHLWPVRGETWRWNVAQLLERFAVVDLEVSDPPIEQIIGGLFERGRVDDSAA